MPSPTSSPMQRSGPHAYLLHITYDNGRQVYDHRVFTERGLRDAHRVAGQYRRQGWHVQVVWAPVHMAGRTLVAPPRPRIA